MPETPHACQIGKDMGRQSRADKGCQISPAPQASNKGIPQKHKTSLNNGLNISIKRITQSSSCTQEGLSLHVALDVARSKPSTRAARVNSTSQDSLHQDDQDRAAKGIATNAEFEKLDRFFNLHRHV